MEIHFLSVEIVKAFHEDHIKLYGGLHGIRDTNLLDSALHYPKTTFDQCYLHSDIYQMAAAYAVGIIKNHPFLDGNKRTGIGAALLFLAYNDVVLNASKEGLWEITMQIAQSKISEEEEVALLFRAHVEFF